MNATQGFIALPSGEQIALPGGFDAAELLLSENCRFVHADLLYAYDPSTGTGLAWCRFPAPHWQLIQPVTREGFAEWANTHGEVLSYRALGILLQGANDVLARVEQSRKAAMRPEGQDAEAADCNPLADPKSRLQ